MSDEAPEGASSRRGGRKLLILVVLPLLVILGAGAGAWFAGLVPLGSPAVEAATADENAAPAAIDPRDIVFVDLPDLLVNLDLDDRRLRFLKFAAALEVVGQQNAELVRQFMPRITDNFHSYLRAIQVAELGGAEAVYRVKRDLLTRVNLVVDPVPVRDVLIKEMLVQ